MPTTSSFIGRDLYLRISDGEKSHVQSHRVWQADTFIASISESQAKEGKSVTVITRDEYMNAIKH